MSINKDITRIADLLGELVTLCQQDIALRTDAESPVQIYEPPAIDVSAAEVPAETALSDAPPPAVAEEDAKARKAAARKQKAAEKKERAAKLAKDEAEAAKNAEANIDDMLGESGSLTEVTPEEVKALAKRVIEGPGGPALRELLKAQGLSRVSEATPDQLGPLYQGMQQLLAG